jgi:hypothetical protein
MRVIYIAGTSHSGSTLLDLMLNAHPAIFSAGEVLKLNRQLGINHPRKQNSAPCSCGAPSLSMPGLVARRCAHPRDRWQVAQRSRHARLWRDRRG